MTYTNKDAPTGAVSLHEALQEVFRDPAIEQVEEALMWAVVNIAKGLPPLGDERL